MSKNSSRVSGTSRTSVRRRLTLVAETPEVIDTAGMRHNALSLLRKASPGSPTTRDMAAKIGVSANMISMFERGEGRLGEAALVKYAKAIGVSPERVREMFLLESHRYFMESAKQVLEELRALGKGRRVAKAS